MGNNSSTLTAGDYLSHDYTKLAEHETQDSGVVSELKFQREPELLYLRRKFHQEKFQHHRFDPKLLQARLKDKTLNQCDLIFVFSDPHDKHCFDLIFEHSPKNIIQYAGQENGLSPKEFIDLIEAALRTGIEKEQKLDNFHEIDETKILVIDGEFKFANPYISDTYVTDVCGN